MTKVGILASVTSGAIARAVGVMPMPIRPTFSLTIISWTMRRALSATPPSSRTIISIFRPATMSPFCWTYSLIAAPSSRPTALKPAPVIGILIPILRTSCAPAKRARTPAAALPAMTLSIVRRNIAFPPGLISSGDFLLDALAKYWARRVPRCIFATFASRPIADMAR